MYVVASEAFFVICICFLAIFVCDFEQSVKFINQLYNNLI